MEFLETLQFQMDFFEENSGGNFKFIKHKWKQNDQKLCNNGQKWIKIGKNEKE